MDIKKHTPTPAYTIDITQEELDVMEAVLANTSGAASAANKLAMKLHKFRTPRNPYSVTVGGEEFTSRSGTGIHFERVSERF